MTIKEELNKEELDQINGGSENDSMVINHNMSKSSDQKQDDKDSTKQYDGNTVWENIT